MSSLPFADADWLARSWAPWKRQHVPTDIARSVWTARQQPGRCTRPLATEKSRTTTPTRTQTSGAKSLSESSIRRHAPAVAFHAQRRPRRLRVVVVVAHEVSWATLHRSEIT